MRFVLSLRHCLECICVLSLLAMGCKPNDALVEVESAPDRPNIFIYLVDTLRRDHLGLYGYDRDTTPHIDAFARDAMVFDDAYSSSGWTKPAVASLLSGLTPPIHGAVTRDSALPQSVLTLGEYLLPLGYETVAVVTNANIIPDWGFDQGFEYFYDVRHETNNRHVDADTVNEWVFKHLNQRDRTVERPLFMYIHTLDPHSPYDPRTPFDRAFGDTAVGQESPAGIAAETDPGVTAGTIRRYDGEIAFNDEQFGRLVEELKGRGLYEDSLIIFLSDHGEEFVDHGRGGHGHTLFQELVHIPMIFKWPGNKLAGTRVSTRAAIIDILPTLLNRLGESAPSVLEGTSLLPLLSSATEKIPDRPVFFDLDLVRANTKTLNVSKSILSGSYKLIEVTSPEKQAMLFDLSKDPTEQVNLAEDMPDLVGRMRMILEAQASASNAGIHFRVCNREDGGDRVISGVLKTNGRFSGLKVSQVEEDDSVMLADGAQTITFEFTQTNQPHPTGGKPEWLVDYDEFAFQINPPDAEFSVEALRSNVDERVPLYVGPDKRGAEKLPISFSGSSDDLVVSEVNALFRRGGEYDYAPPMGAYLVRVPGVERLDIGLDSLPKDVLEALKAMGYVGGGEGKAKDDPDAEKHPE